MKRFLVSAMLVLCLAPAARALEIHFLPTPCRVLDSRSALTLPGPWVPGTPQAVRLREPNGASSNQGGEANCGVPTSAQGAIVNVAAIRPTGTGGYLRIWPFTENEPAITTRINMTAPEGLAVSNEVHLELGALGESADVWVSVSAEAHVVIDIIGYIDQAADALLAGVVASKTTASDGSVDLLLTSGLHLVCVAPWTDPFTECAPAAEGSAVQAAGHVQNFFGAIYLYAHGEVGVTP